MGTLAILAGALFGCLAGFYCFFAASFMPGGPESSTFTESIMVSTGLLMALFAAEIIWLGVGTVRLRRWAGDLFLAVGWLFGVLVAAYVVALIFYLPRIIAETSAMMQVQSGTTDPRQVQVMQITLLVTMVVGFFLYLVPPLVAILVFRMKSVKRTFAQHDRKPSWTDGLALPVLICWVWMVQMSVSVLGMAPGYGPVYQQMGLVKESWEAVAIMLGVGVLAGVCAWGILTRKAWSWYGCFGMSLLMAAFAWIFVVGTDFAGMYRKMGMSEEQVKPIMAFNGGGSMYTVPAVLIAGGIILFLLMTKRCFRFDGEKGRN